MVHFQKLSPWKTTKYSKFKEKSKNSKTRSNCFRYQRFSRYLLLILSFSNSSTLLSHYFCYLDLPNPERERILENLSTGALHSSEFKHAITMAHATLKMRGEIIRILGLSNWNECLAKYPELSNNSELKRYFLFLKVIYRCLFILTTKFKLYLRYTSCFIKKTREPLVSFTAFINAIKSGKVEIGNAEKYNNCSYQVILADVLTQLSTLSELNTQSIFFYYYYTHNLIL